MKRSGSRAGIGCSALTAARFVCINTHLNSTHIIARLLAEGRREVARKGSHAQFTHPARPGRVTVPHPRKDLPIGTVKSIERQSGLKLI